MIVELLEDLSLIQYAFIQNRLIESMIKNLRELLQDQSFSETSSLLNKHTSFFFNHQASSFIQLSFKQLSSSSL